MGVAPGGQAVSALLLEPHQDDAVLFAAFTCLRHRPLVVTVLASQLQADRGTGITNERREAENAHALGLLGCEVEQWGYPDSGPDWTAVQWAMRSLAGEGEFELVFAPAVEDGGHEQHSEVGRIALQVFGDRVRPYLTYRRGHGRTVGQEVVPQPEWIGLKLRAMACFASQIAEPSTRPWFLDGIREYVP